MSPKLPSISGRKAITVFETIGYQVVRQKGSHIRLRDDKNPDHKPLTVPDHKSLKAGLLRTLIRDAGLSVEDFVKLLQS
jgi:predicted RNA binding protein YcfA (HicA-like mRNA interferase family)